MFFTFPGYSCSNGEYNDLAVLAFNPQGFKIQALFAAPHRTFHVSSLLLYSAFYYFLAAITYGAFIPSGLFTVSLIFGGCFGRIWAEVLLMMGAIDGSQPGIVGMYALLGAGEAVGALPHVGVNVYLEGTARAKLASVAGELCPFQPGTCMQ
jgi:chloride channel 7